MFGRIFVGKGQHRVSPYKPYSMHFDDRIEILPGYLILILLITFVIVRLLTGLQKRIVPSIYYIRVADEA